MTSRVILTLAAMSLPAAGRPRTVENLVNVSWGDQIMVARGDAQLDTAAKIRRAMKSWLVGYGGRTILWRGSAYSIQRYYERRTAAKNSFIRAYYKKVAQVRAACDPAKVARQAARENGQQFLIYLTVFDHGAPASVLYGGTTPFPWQDRFTVEHPEFQTVDREGNLHHGILEMAYPESRRLMVERIKGFVEEFDTDGVYVCTRTHSLPALDADQFGFSPPVVEAVKRRYGVDILKDPRFDTKNAAFDPHDEMVEEWRRLRGSYVVELYRDLRAALPGKVIYTGIPRGRYAGPPYGNRYLDWESLVRERLVDGLVIGVYAGKGLHPPLYVPHAKIGYLSSEDDRINVPSPEKAVAEVYGPLCRTHDVKLFHNSGGFGPRHRRWFQRERHLDGFMIYTPSGGSQIVVGHDDALCGAGGSLTIEAFVYVDRLPKAHEGWPRILSKYDHQDNPRHRGWEWVIMPNGRFRFRVNQQDPAKPDGGGDVSVDSPAPVPIGRWLHVATVYDLDRRELRLVLDGKQAARRDIRPWPIRINRQQDLYFGRYGGADSSRFRGRIDELRIVADALALSRPPKTPYTGKEPHTVALYHFDQVTAGNLADAAGGRHAASLLSGAGPPLAPSCNGFGQALRLAPAGR